MSLNCWSLLFLRAGFLQVKCLYWMSTVHDMEFAAVIDISATSVTCWTGQKLA